MAGAFDAVAGAFTGGSGGDKESGGASSATDTTTKTSTAVNPNFQQSFSAQVSPVIQVSSGSGSQRGAVDQSLTETQSAESAGMPGFNDDAGYVGAPMSPSFVDRYAPRYAPAQIPGYGAAESGVFNIEKTNWALLALGAVGILGVGFLLLKK